MKDNINTKEYWESRFQKNWKKNGATQTTEYAKANVKHIPLAANFRGTLLDFGCALGDAIPIYSQAFPQAKLSGIDISETAINTCKKKYGTIADFFTGGINDLNSFDTIVASHVMEHITDDKVIVRALLKKCRDLFVFVPFKENPLFIEHVNYYEQDYYDDIHPVEIKTFKVQYVRKMPLKTVVKNLLKFRYIPNYFFSKDIIMFHLKGINEPIANQKNLSQIS